MAFGRRLLGDDGLEAELMRSRLLALGRPMAGLAGVIGLDVGDGRKVGDVDSEENTVVFVGRSGGRRGRAPVVSSDIRRYACFSHKLFHAMSSLTSSCHLTET